MPETVIPETEIAKPQQESNLSVTMPNPAPQEPTIADTAPAQEPETTVTEVPVEAGPAALREAAMTGDPRALFEIGNRYMEGRGVQENLAEAAKWFETSAAKGFAPALYRMGNFNEKGLGMPRNLTKAVDWYQQAAKQGNTSAMHNLAVLLHRVPMAHPTMHPLCTGLPKLQNSASRIANIISAFSPPRAWECR